MRRRDFIALIGGSGIAFQVPARAQQSAKETENPLVGFLGLTSPQDFAQELAAFHRGLGELGFIDGRDVRIDYRWAQGRFDQLPALATDLTRQRLSVLVATGTPASALAAKAATETIPIVFVSGADPVQMGLVPNFNHPGGNVTGVYFLTAALEPKRLELVRELVPNTRVIAVIVNPNSPDTKLQMRELPAAAGALDRQIKIFNVGSEKEIEAAFAAIVEQRIGAVVVTSSPTYLPWREHFVAIAARHAVPTIYFLRAFAEAGGLMSYGTSLIDAYRQVGIYTGGVLKGEKPGDLPVQQSVKVELILNIKTAKTLGLAIPIPLLGRVDEVIE
jgi:putative tryptophan/tyrosine transport system substrate-binding protein